MFLFVFVFVCVFVIAIVITSLRAKLVSTFGTLRLTAEGYSRLLQQLIWLITGLTLAIRDNLILFFKYGKIVKKKLQF